MTDEKKSKRVHMGLAILYLCSSMFLGVIFVLSLKDVRAQYEDPVYFLISTSVVFIASAFHFFVGRGIMNGKRWAQRASLVAAVLLLFGFPLGTAIGIYLLWCNPIFRDGELGP